MFVWFRRATASRRIRDNVLSSQGLLVAVDVRLLVTSERREPSKLGLNLHSEATFTEPGG